MVGNLPTYLVCVATLTVSLPTLAKNETYGAWQFGKINEVCAAASHSVDGNDGRSFNIMVTGSDQILLYIVLGSEVPNGPRHFGLQMSNQVFWLVGVVEDGVLLFDLSIHPESSRVLTEIIDGRTLILIGGLGGSVARFSLNGSGQAVARLAECAEDNQEG